MERPLFTYSIQRVTADGALAARNVSERGEVLGRQDPPG